MLCGTVNKIINFTSGRLINKSDVCRQFCIMCMFYCDIIIEMEVFSTEKPFGCPASVAALEKFILLSESAQGAASAELVNQVLNTPVIYGFSELLVMPNVKDVSCITICSISIIMGW